MIKLALAQLPHPPSFAQGLAAVLDGIAAAASRRARVVCFPECTLKGMRGCGFAVEPLTAAEHDEALARVRAAAATHAVHVILPTERPLAPPELGGAPLTSVPWDKEGPEPLRALRGSPSLAGGGAWQNGAYVVAATGELVGYQSKNQLPVEEEPWFQPGDMRRLFVLDGVPVGVVICHEGWRYPETVRWAAARGARIVFHASFCGGAEPAGGGDDEPPWGSTFYERAMACRAGENHVWFASVNYALPMQECRSTVVSPEGEPIAAAPLHEPALLVVEIDPGAATGYLARRLAPERYRAAE